MISRAPGPEFRKNRKQEAKTPNEVPPEALGISFTKPHIILTRTYCPSTYSITLESDTKIELLISPQGANSIEISHSKVSLSRKCRTIDITVSSKHNRNQEIDLLHWNTDQQVACVLKIYVLGPEGSEVCTAGTDKHYQLSHGFSINRFTSQLECSLERTEFNTKRAFILRPTPETIHNNKEILVTFKEPNICCVNYPEWVGIGAGELHSLACTSDGRLYSWGTGLFGQLGIPLSHFKSQQASLIEPNAKGYWYHRIREISLETSIPENLKETIESSYKVPYIPVSPALIEVPFEFPVSSVACGQYHSLILSEGVPYSFGLGLSGRLGLGTEEPAHTPAKILLPLSCIKIAAGYSTSFFIVDSLAVFSCGNHSGGALGHDSQKLLPTQITFLQGVHSLSSAETHTGAATVEGKAVLFGSNADNKLGGPSPHTLSSIENCRILGVYCGGRHTCALTEPLEVYAWGHNASGQCGLSSTMFHSMSNPVKIEYLSGRCVVDLSLGQDHSTAITVDGLLYCWGSNLKGQLAIGTLAKEFTRVGLPRLIDAFLGTPVSCIATRKHGTVFVSSAPNTDTSTLMFYSWKRGLLAEEKHRQELANYRFSLLIRNLKKSSLVKRIQEERDRVCRRVGRIHREDRMNSPVAAVLSVQAKSEQRISHGETRVMSVLRRRSRRKKNRRRKSLYTGGAITYMFSLDASGHGNVINQ